MNSNQELEGIVITWHHQYSTTLNLSNQRARLITTRPRVTKDTQIYLY